MVYNIIPAGAGGFKIREEDGKGNHIKTWPGIHQTVVEAQAHITEMTTPKTKTAAQLKADEKAVADKQAADDKVAADKAEADAALEKENAPKEEVADEEKEEVADKEEEKEEEVPAAKGKGKGGK